VPLGGLIFVFASAIAVGVALAIYRRRRAHLRPNAISKTCRATTDRNSAGAPSEGTAATGVASPPEPKAEDRKSAAINTTDTRPANASDVERKSAEDAQRRAEELARLAAGHRVRRKAAEQARRVAEAEARREAAAQEELRKADEADEAQQHSEALAHIAASAEATEPAAEEVQEPAICDAERQAAAQPKLTAADEAPRKNVEQASTDAAGEPPGAAATEPKHSAPEDKSPTIDPVSHPKDSRRYRPSARVASTPPAPPIVSTEREPRQRAAPIEVRLLFEKAGFCRVSLLPRRVSGMPAELPVTGSGNPPPLLELQDNWYQDVILSDLGPLLRDGVEWVGPLPDGSSFRASLSGRDIYVLKRHDDISGFVSTRRLILGEEHVILCTVDRVGQVRAALELAGSPAPSLLTADSGVPAGWFALRGVSPRIPVAPSATGDILDALRPLPDVEISLAGGIRIGRQTWLEGFPPMIQLRGDATAIVAVQIDGIEATRDSDGNYTAGGWNTPGDHSVSCVSGSRTYSIRRGREEWAAWDAYRWSLGEIGAESKHSHPALCGVLVRPPQAVGTGCRPIVVPSSNTVLIGAAPGQLEICARRSDISAGLCIGFPHFEVVWALPADAIHCDKRATHVLALGPLPAVARRNESAERPPTKRELQDIYTWCEAILSVGRKGLATHPSDSHVTDLWKSYKRAARALRKKFR
jgi:hypothetical protein